MCSPHGNGNDGTCQCESLFGFYGPACEKLSAASFLLLALSLGIIIHSFYANYVSDYYVAGADLTQSNNHSTRDKFRMHR